MTLGYVELSWYFFAIGLLFWLVLLTLVFNRLMFHDPMPGKLKPTIAILVAPPALAFTNWTLFHGDVVDAPARLFLNLAYFFLALVLVQLPSLLRLPFSLSFWAWSFPLAAVTGASFRFAEFTGSSFHLGLSWVLLAALVAAISALAALTLRAAFNDTLFVPD